MPTTTSQCAARNRRTACSSSRTDVDGRILAFTSLTPIRITATCGPSSSAVSTCGVRSLDIAPVTDTSTSRTGRWASSARPEASSTPGVSSGDAVPYPAALESPIIASVTG